MPQAQYDAQGEAHPLLLGACPMFIVCVPGHCQGTDTFLGNGYVLTVCMRKSANEL